MLGAAAVAPVNYDTKDNRELELAWLAVKHKNLGAGGVIGAVLEGGGNAGPAISELEANQRALTAMKAVVEERVEHAEKWVPFLKASGWSILGSLAGSGVLAGAVAYDDTAAQEGDETSSERVVLNIFKAIGLGIFGWGVGKVALKKAELDEEQEALERLKVIVDTDLQTAATMTRVFKAYGAPAQSPQELRALARAPVQLPPEVRERFEQHMVGALMHQPYLQAHWGDDEAKPAPGGAPPVPRFLQRLRTGVGQLHTADRVRCLARTSTLSGSAVQQSPMLASAAGVALDSSSSPSPLMVTGHSISAAQLARMLAEDDSAGEEDGDSDLDATLTSLAARQSPDRHSPTHAVAASVGSSQHTAHTDEVVVTVHDAEEVDAVPPPPVPVSTASTPPPPPATESVHDRMVSRLPGSDSSIV
ncbi:MAG: hypothetical protein SP1CHLAM54_01400 [Chlamydiia bacterium]|nr:hypothetical protein [Chlamydiia bacterium]